MKRYLKTLEEVLEVVPDESGGQTLRRTGESMDVQLDRWRLQQKESEERIVVIRYELSTVVEPKPFDSRSTVVNTMSILYSRMEELVPFGVMVGLDPLEWTMYQSIASKLDDRILTGRILFLCPSPLMTFTRRGDVEVSGFRRGDSDPETYGENIYDTVVADRELSRCVDPAAAVAAVKSALHDGGAFLVIEDGHANRDALRSFSLEGLDTLLKDFSVEHRNASGNALGVVHKIASGGNWIPTRLDGFLSNDSECPVYVWVLARA